MSNESATKTGAMTILLLKIVILPYRQCIVNCAISPSKQHQLSVNAMTANPIAEIVNHHRVQLLLSREAMLADSHQYDAWLELWHADALYRVPCNNDEADPKKTVFLLCERFPQIQERIKRLAGKRAHAQSPKSRLARVIGNIMITGRNGDEMTVTSSFVVGEWRAETQTNWYGHSLHVLVESGGDLLIKQKDVFLINNDGILGNLQFLI
jgi:3-phenylpropionate/cinnamic acid dioxygenase small subunit